MEFLADLDSGPSLCHFLQHLDSVDGPTIENMLGFADDFTCLAKKLNRLVESYQTQLSSQIRSGLNAATLASWIFHNNIFEFAGTETEAETEALLNSGLSVSDCQTPKELDVITTAQLIKTTFNPCSIDKKGLDIIVLKGWHNQLFFHDASYNPGKTRSCGVKTITRDGSDHIYLHHEVAQKALQTFLFVVHKLCQLIPKSKNPTLYTFALAAFAQFHFVDIHPFQDGNGRICRLISKYFLDSISPLPIPIRNRNEYLKTLENARLSSPSDAPKSLCRLLFHEALLCFSKPIKEYHVDFKLKLSFVANDKMQLSAQIAEYEKHEQLDPAMKEAIFSTWEELDAGQSRRLDFSNLEIFLEKDFNLGSLLDSD